MCRALIASAVVLCLVGVSLHVRHRHRPRHAPPPPPPLARPAAAPVAQLVPRGRVLLDDPDEEGRTWTVTGYGLSEADAEQVALNNALARVNDFLGKQAPPLTWRPSAGYVDRNLVKERNTKLEEAPKGMEDVPIHLPGDGKQLYKTTLKVEVDPPHYRDMLENDRQQRAEERHLLLAKVVAGLLALLVAVFGYFRLEEMTRGYYTLWLRLAAIALVAAAGAVLVVIV